jgi:proteasome lid subunit RPN8/RPN11
VSEAKPASILLAPEALAAIRAEAARAYPVRLVGFWHSHPDHPARPSPTDRRYAWEGLLTLVIRVEKGEPREITGWEVPGPDEPFREVPLAVGSDRKEASCPSS